MDRQSYNTLRYLMTQYTSPNPEIFLTDSELHALYRLMQSFADVMEAQAWGSLGLSEQEAEECNEECAQIAHSWTVPAKKNLKRIGMQVAVIAGIAVLIALSSGVKKFW